MDILSPCPLYPAVTVVSASPKEYRRIGLLWETASGIVLSVLGSPVDTRLCVSLRSLLLLRDVVARGVQEIWFL